MAGGNSRTAEAFSAAMLLGAAGDAMGFKNGEWEFCYDSKLLHLAVEQMGFDEILLKPPEFIVSDDTVMHMATARALINAGAADDQEKLFHELAKQYVACMGDMTGRSPGMQTIASCNELKANLGKSYAVPYSPKAGGCGAAMRSMCIGLLYNRPHQLRKLVAAAVESGRMTHNHPTGFLGSVASALFASLAVQSAPLCRWGYELLHTALPEAWAYVEKSGRDTQHYKATWSYFEEAWARYLTSRRLLDGRGPAVFPEPYGIIERDDYFAAVSFSGWPGSSGHDAPMIAYDALLGAGGDWRRLCDRAVFHGGDNDSTGTIAAFCFALGNGGLRGVPPAHWEKLEYHDELKAMGNQLFSLSERL